MQGAIDYITATGQYRIVKLGKGRDVLEHAVLEWQPHRLTWTVSVPSDGLLEVNSRKVGAGTAVPLVHLDEVLIGRLRARFLRMPETPLLRGKPCREVVLDQRRLLIGRADGTTAGEHQPGHERWLLDAEDDRRTAKVHVEVFPSGAGHAIRDRSPTGTYLNGAVFSEKQLVPGDRFIIGSYTFEYTGSSICCVDSLLGARVEGRDLGLTVRHEGRLKTILQQVGIEIHAGEFVGILGGSGQGKSTLMNVLGGLLLPTTGRVLIDGEPLGTSLLSGCVIGFVPQDDIVHTELTVTQALTLTARLRLGVSRPAIHALVSGVISKLGLNEHAGKPVRILSGGQRKRVNIATELLVRPSVLFLDEPTSGLDPENEESVVGTLQNLCLTGQTVICTTHSLHKAFLFNRIAFVHEGRLLFLGNLDEAREHFLTADKDDTATATSTDTSNPAFRLERIYKKVNEEKNSDKWLARFLKSPLAPFSTSAFPPRRRVFSRPPRLARPGFFSTLWVLSATQWHILAADRKNIRSLLLQAVGIGLLSGWVGREDPEFRFFACLIATLWFGCSNAAQTIVRELPIFRRERIAGLELSPYILSKTLFLAGIAWTQVLLLLASQTVPVWLSGVGGTKLPAHDLLPTGSTWLAVMAFGLMGLVGVQIGLALSSMARTVTQATLWVPLALIPQILFSGFVVTRPDMPDSARLFSLVVPSASAQRLIDLANVHQKPVPVMTDDTEVPMFFSTDETLRPLRTPGTGPKASGTSKRYRELDEYNTSWQNSVVDPAQLGAHKPSVEEGADKKDYVKSRDDLLPLWQASQWPAGQPYDASPQVSGAAIALGVWSLICYAVTWLGLSLAQPAPLRPAWLRRRYDA